MEPTKKALLKHRELTGRIIKVFFSVYNEMGHGYLESVYQRSLAVAFEEEGLTAAQECELAVWFRGRVVGDFRADFIVENRVLVELKCARKIDPAHEAQVINYLRATDLEVGLLLNFGPVPAFRRLAFENRRKQVPDPRPSA